MALGYTFSSAFLILGSVDPDLNGKAQATKPSHLLSFFPSHYLYGWLAHYFKTHRVIQHTPLGPLMLHYSGFTKHNKRRDVCKLIHKGNVSKLGCLMLPKNCPDVTVNNGDLDNAGFDDLVARRDGFLPIRRGAYLYVKPYSRH